MKKVSLIIIGTALSVMTFAQGKYGKTPEDSVACIENLIYKDYMSSDPALALSLWKKAIAVCPSSQLSLYINGVKLYQGMIKNTTDAKLQQAYKDTMYSILDQRIVYFGDKAKVLGIKGQTMLVYSKTETQKIFDVLNESIDLGGEETEAGTLVASMFAVSNLQKEGKKTQADVVEMYEKTSAIASKKQEEVYVEAQKTIQSIAPTP